MKRYLFFIFFSITTMMAFSQDIIGEWDGTLNVQNTSLRLVFHISKTDNGYSATMDSPDQGAKGLMMSHVTFEDSTLIIELRVATIKYTGKLDKNVLTGTFSQAGQEMPMNSTKNEIALIQPILQPITMQLCLWLTDL